MKELEVGQTREGVVTNLMAFGAFVDLGGVEGLLHVSDLAHNRVDKPGDLLSVGQTVTVMVLKLENLHGEDANKPRSEEQGSATDRGTAGGGVKAATPKPGGGKKKRNRPRIALGIKQTTPDPWEGLADRYTEGENISVRVVKTTTFGAFAEIEPGVEGLLPISELAWNRTEKVEDVVKKGDAIKVQILKIETNKKRFTLSLKAAAGDPWSTGEGGEGDGGGLGVSAGESVKGKVTTVTDFGAFVALESGVEGLVHISELADRRVDKVTDILNIGDEKMFKVKSVEPEKRKIALSLRTKPSPREAREAEEAQLMQNQPKAKPRLDKRNLKSGLGGGGGMGQGLGGLSLSDFNK